MLSFTLITAGIFIMGLMLMTASFINNKKYHFGVILYLKNISLEDATHAMRRFLEMKGIEYELERPKGWSYRGYLSPPKVAFYVKKEFFIGIHYFTGPEKKIIRQIKIMYLASIWEEALIFQKEMDEYSGTTPGRTGSIKVIRDLRQTANPRTVIYI